MAIKLNGNDCSIVDTARKLTSESDDIIDDDESAHHHAAPRNNPSANKMPMMNKFTAQWMLGCKLWRNYDQSSSGSSSMFLSFSVFFLQLETQLEVAQG
jgi:hypothetical protein